MCENVESQCSGRGLVHFFAMAALLNVALTNLKNDRMQIFS